MINKSPSTQCEYSHCSLINTDDSGQVFALQYITIQYRVLRYFRKSLMRSAESLVVYYHFTVFSNHSEGTHNDQTLHLSNQPLQGTLLTPFTPPSVSLINTSDDTAKDQAIFFHSLLPTRSVLFFTALSLSFSIIFSLCHRHVAYVHAYTLAHMHVQAQMPTPHHKRVKPEKNGF